MEQKIISSKKADVIIDLQFGSTGKGLIAGYLAEKNGYDTVINANMPNAGHTYINDEGREWVHKVLPNGIVSPNIKRVMLGAGSVFDVDRLRKELADSSDIMGGVKLIIHPFACVLDPHHKAMEAATLNGIASTMQGSAAAMVEKIWRQAGQTPVAHVALQNTELAGNVCTVEEWQQHIIEAESILVEGAQGYSLGINAGFYPYCTSRDCTPTRFMSDCGVPHRMLRKVIGTARVHPIRVGNTKGGYSGDFYPDQHELTWDGLGVDAETTTVTGRVRRVFSFSKLQIEAAIKECQPDEVFLNFCNYDAEDATKADSVIKAALHDYYPWGEVKYWGYGPSRKEVSEHFIPF